MRAKKTWQVLKTVGENFSIGAGVASVFFSILAVFVVIPLTIIFPITGAIGFLFAFIGAYYMLKELNKKEHKNAVKKNQQNDEVFHENEKELLFLTNEIKHDLHQIRKRLKKQQLVTDKEDQVLVDANDLQLSISQVREKINQLDFPKNKNSTSSIFHKLSYPLEEIQHMFSHEPTLEEIICSSEVKIKNKDAPQNDSVFDEGEQQLTRKFC